MWEVDSQLIQETIYGAVIAMQQLKSMKKTASQRRSSKAKLLETLKAH